MVPTDQWEIRVTSSLRSLALRPDFTELRKRICDEAGISQPAFSQYLREESPRPPSLRVLVAIAKVLNLSSLDELVFGRPGYQAIDYAMFERYMRGHTAQQRREQLAQERAFMAIIEELGRTIRNAAMHGRGPDLRLDTIEADHTSDLQGFSRESWLIHLTLRSFSRSPQGEGLTPVFDTVCNNLRLGREYRVLFSGHWEKAGEEARTLLNALERQNVATTKIQFRLTDERTPLLTSCGFLRLDWTELKKRDSFLHTRLQQWRNADHPEETQRDWIGYAGDPRVEPRVDTFMDKRYLTKGLEAFNRLWELARPFPEERITTARSVPEEQTALPAEASDTGEAATLVPRSRSRVSRFPIEQDLRNVPLSVQGVSQFIRALEDEDWRVRVSAALFLADIGPLAIRGSKKLIPGLIKALAKDEVLARQDRKAALKVRSAAAYALAEIGPAAKDAVPALRQALAESEPEPDLHYEVARALWRIGPAARDAIDDLWAALHRTRGGEAGVQIRDAILALEHRDDLPQAVERDAPDGDDR